MNRLLILLLFLSAAVSHAEGFSRVELQQFIDDAIQAGGGEVVLPPGTHRIDQPLVLKNASNIRLAGLDPEDTFLCPVESATKPFPLIRVEGTADNLEIAKITFTTAGAEFADTPLIEVHARLPQVKPEPATGKDKQQAAAPESAGPSTTLRIDRCLFEEHRGCGILLHDSANVKVTANSFCDLADGALRATGSTTGLLLQHNHFIRCGSFTLTLDPTTRQALITANEFHGSSSLKLEGTDHLLSDNGGLSVSQ